MVGLSGARVLVLGGSGVLGGHIAAALKERGARVVLAGRDRDRLHRAATALGPATPSVLFDLREPSHARHVVDAAVAALGGLDGLVNAAGVVAFGPFAELSDGTLDDLVATDLVGPLRVMRAALPHLDEGGFVVNLTGVVAERPVPGIVAYSAVKAGLSAAGAGLAAELRRHGVRFLDARPPHTETGLANRPISGSAPRFPAGLDPAVVAARIVSGIEAGEREIPAEAFAPGA